MNNQFRAIEALSATEFTNLTDEGKLFARILLYVAQGVDVRRAIDIVCGVGTAGVLIEEIYSAFNGIAI